MKKNCYLLSDETNGISAKDLAERELLVQELSKQEEHFFSKMRHFQPQIGCLNACKICSKHASSTTAYWKEDRIRNVIAALLHIGKTYREEKPYIVWDREEHRTGVIFSYLDNDIGNYPYLDKFVEIAYRELGVKTRISTVGFSRYNEQLCNMHAKINEGDSLDALGGVRLSFTPYPIGWCSTDDKFNRNDYIEDIAAFLSIYRPYYLNHGKGSRKMCVELRYKPLVVLAPVYVTEVIGYTVISTGNYLYISQEQNIELKQSFIADPYNHLIQLTEKSEMFNEFSLYIPLETVEDVKHYAHRFILAEKDKSTNPKAVEVYMLANAEGEYYSIDPQITEKGNYGINIYPETETRINSGYIITERFLINALIEYKEKFRLKSLDRFETATWSDVYNVINICKINASVYISQCKKEKAEYIMEELLPMIEAYIFALQKANYEPADFFDADFTIDTGIICNLGRAMKEFKGITFTKDEPLTPTHERNYGRHNSTMTKEGIAYRLSCEYDDSIIIEKLNLASTASENGQLMYKETIKLNTNDELNVLSDLNEMYLVPGQRRK